MKKVYLNATNLLSGARKLTTCTAILLAGVLVSCSDDDVKNGDDDEVTENSPVALTVISGASQKGRVQSVVNPRALAKKERLAYVGKIAPLDHKSEYNWSATAVAFSDDGTKAYITWHSNKQAKNPAGAWGGAVDIVDATSLNLDVTAYTESELKFNHVLYTKDNLFLGSISATDAGVVGRLALSNDVFTTDASVDVIGFPGVSVNAVAKYGDKLIAVSGYKGTYGTFAPDAQAQPYYYGDKEKRENVVSIEVDYSEDFGGKYVTTDENGDVYVLHNTDNATITKVGGASVSLGIGLLSAVKVPETYDPITKDWVLSTEEHDYYGKHVFAVQDGKAYVACGKNGLVVYDFAAGKVIHTEPLKTTGVCVADDYVYASTEIGLQVYHWVGDVFHRYAFEVEKYDETTGAPLSKVSPVSGTEERHSPNFVAVNPVNKHIYVAYGQSGVRVYKFVEEEAGAEE